MNVSSPKHVCLFALGRDDGLNCVRFEGLVERSVRSLLTSFSVISNEEVVPLRLQQHRRTMSPLHSYTEHLLNTVLLGPIKHHCCNLCFSRKADVVYF